MAQKKPLCNYSGLIKELQAGDTLPSGSLPALVLKTTDFITTSTTYVDVTDFNFNLAANKKYKVKLSFWIFQSVSAAYGTYLAINKPTTASFYGLSGQSSATFVPHYIDYFVNNRLSTLNISITNTVPECRLTVDFLLLMGEEAGTIQFQIKSDPGGEAWFRNGSFIIIEEVL